MAPKVLEERSLCPRDWRRTRFTFPHHLRSRHWWSRVRTPSLGGSDLHREPAASTSTGPPAHTSPGCPGAQNLNQAHSVLFVIVCSFLFFSSLYLLCLFSFFSLKSRCLKELLAYERASHRTLPRGVCSGTGVGLLECSLGGRG